MRGSDIRKLIGKLNETTTSLLDQAAGFCLTRTHYSITMEHLLLKALDDGRGDIPLILRHYGVDTGTLQKNLLDTLEKFRSGNAAKATFSPVLLEQIEAAWLLASITMEDKKVRSGYIFCALLEQPEYLSSYDYGEDLEKIDSKDVCSRFNDICASSIESTQVMAPGVGEQGQTEINEDSYLGRYTSDLTEAAAGGKIDPVLRRDREIREMIGILSRRRKNNPICVGDPGVGKSAVVEGLALRIVEGDVPDVLKGVTIRGLDMGVLQAGAGVKGEFEKRLKGIIEEVKASEAPILLFVDEAHTLIGAGGPSGGSDAANLLKPALARGELRTIASTTWSEYKKYFEKDAALARRFQLVQIGEPSVEHAIDIVRGLKGHYERAHDVTILDEAAVDCVRLSNRYISGRQLPDKAIDLLDTACARIRINLTSKPGELDDVERNLSALETTIESLESMRTLSDEQRETLDMSLASKFELESTRNRLEKRWKEEKEVVEAILEAQKAGDAEKESSAREKLASIQNGEPMITPEVDTETICKVVTDWTGIPLSRMIADEATTLLDLEASLQKRIKGQDWAMEVLSQTIRASKANIKPRETPVGCCLLVGPSGVGKTETALALADLLYGGEQFVTTINMSEFQEKHTVSRLVGSPPGYVGYGEGGFLTEALRKRPYSIVLIDETEKAHPDVLNIFYQVFDKGILSDGEGREVDCRNALFLLTSNLATDTITKMSESAVLPEMEDLVAEIRPELSAFFKPALLARMTIVPYLTLPPDVLKDITRLKLNKLKNRVFEAQRIEMVYGDPVVDGIVSRCKEVETGARSIDQTIAQFIMPRASNEILQSLSRGAKLAQLNLGYNDNGFSFSVTTTDDKQPQ